MTLLARPWIGAARARRRLASDRRADVVWCAGVLYHAPNSLLAIAIAGPG
jgi:hypothetical protein